MCSVFQVACHYIFNAGLSLLPRMGDIVIRIYDKKQLYFHLFESWIKTIYLFQLTELKKKRSLARNARLRRRRRCAISSTQISNLLSNIFFCFKPSTFFFIPVSTIRGCIIFEFRVAFVRIFRTCKEFLYTSIFFFFSRYEKRNIYEKKGTALNLDWADTRKKERKKKEIHFIKVVKQQQ